MKVLILILVLGVSILGVESQSSPIVETKYGKVQGTSLQSRKANTYYAYLGIPYGKVPERFADSVPPDSWTEVKDTKTMPTSCFQYFILTNSMQGKEDCLHLNVYTMNVNKPDAKRPVLVWIFPGGFQIGGAEHFHGGYIMDHGVVLVTIDYRLGALGFLNTGDGTVAGNMGLKDQVLALKWVKENIANFGGDPNLVTIYGISAGGASVDYLTISPMAKGLFHRAIAMSGSSLNPWAFQYHPTHLAQKLAEFSGCSEGKEDWKEKVKCLRTKEPSAIVTAQLRLMKLGFQEDFIHMKFSPSVESDKVKGPRFLENTPYSLLSNGKIANKVPYMTGYSEDEGALYSAPIMKEERIYTKVDKEWVEMAPYMFYYEDLVAHDKMASVSKKIRKFYELDGKKLGKGVRRNLSNIYSDRFFSNGVAKGIELHGKHHDVYPYIFHYKGAFSMTSHIYGEEMKDGVGHIDELIYMFNKPFGGPESHLFTDDGELSARLLKLIVAFAKDGKPTGTWGSVTNWPKYNPTSSKRIQFYKIDFNNTAIVEDPLYERRSFWEELPIKEHAKEDKEINAESKDEL